MKLRIVMATLGALLLASMFTASTASAHTGSPPRGECATVWLTSFGSTCFEWDGDDQWVSDSDANGWSTGVQIQTNYPSGDQARKTRWCVNNHSAGTWHECKFDHKESGCVRFQMYEQNLSAPGDPVRNATGFGPWYSIRTGLTC